MAPPPGKHLPLAHEGRFLGQLVQGTTGGKPSTPQVLMGAVDGGMPVERSTIALLQKLGPQAEAVVAGSMVTASMKREGELNARIDRLSEVPPPGQKPAATASASVASAKADFPTLKPNGFV